MRKTIIFVISTLLICGCLSVPAREKICPDGTLLQENAYCKGYVADNISTQSVTNNLSTQSERLVTKANERVSLRVSMETGYDIMEYTEGDASPGFQYYSTIGHRIFNTSNLSDSDTIQQIGENEYAVFFDMPRIPGNYTIDIDGINGSKVLRKMTINVTVIEGVENDTLAYMIVDKFASNAVYNDLRENEPDKNIYNWQIASKSISRHEKNLTVSMVTTYDVCEGDLSATKIIIQSRKILS